MDLQKMDALIASWQDEILEHMKAWIAVPSVQTARSGENAPFGDALRQMLDLFLKDAAAMGFEVDDVDGYAGSAQMGHGEKTMGMLAHLDIVPAGDGWTSDPFVGTLRDGKFYGRGTADDKGPALAALYAMRAVREAGVPLRDGVRLIVGCDEETGMTDMRHYASVRKMPDYGFSPDAEYPLINIEKGGLTLKISKETGGEAGADVPVYALNAGMRVNVVPGTAYAIVGASGEKLAAIQRALAEICARHERFQVTATDIGEGRARIESVGVQSHAAMPEAGFNAAGALLIALMELGVGGAGVKSAIEGVAKLVGVEYDGHSLGIARCDEISGPLTCNLGILRYDGQSFSVQLDNRYPICADETDLCGCAAMKLSPFGLSMLRMSGRVPLHVPADSEIVKGLLAVYEEMTGLPGYALAIGGGTYSRMMPNTVAFGISFPGDVDTCHMPDEHVEVEKFMCSVKIMAHAIARLAGAEA